MSTSSQSMPEAHSDSHNIEEMKHHIRRYLIVGVALIFGTILTVWASLINFGSIEYNIAVALLIASAKGFLVVGFFMHLISEKKMIYSVLSFTIFFFAALFYLTLWSMAHGSVIQLH